MLYLQINFLLGLTFILFVICQFFLRKLNILSTSLSALRCAQVLVLLSLAAPIAFKIIPTDTIEEVTFRPMPELSENLNQLSSEIKSQTIVLKEKAPEV